MHTKVGTSARLNRPSGRRRVFYLNNDRPIWTDLKSNAAVWVKGQDIDPQMDADAADTLLLGCANPDEGQKESPIRAKSIEKKTLVATGFLIDRSPLRIASFAASAWSGNHRIIATLVVGKWIAATVLGRAFDYTPARIDNMGADPAAGPIHACRNACRLSHSDRGRSADAG